MNAYNEKSSKNQSGYTLIEMAISLMIVGLLFGAGVALYGQYIKQTRVDTTLTNLDTALVKIDEFQRSKGRLPCPAPLNVARTAPNYGAENTANCLAAIMAGPGKCLNGICVEQTVRTDLGLGAIPIAPITENYVLVGAIPFRALQIPEKDTFDGYSDRIVYAVTYSATDDTTYNASKGAISVKNYSNSSLTTKDGSVLYLALSHGENRMGAYSHIGVLVSPCTAGTQESGNCNIGFETGIELSPLAIYKSTLQSTGANADYFDDYVAYYSKNTDPTWRRTTANYNNIQDLSPRNIGVGQASGGAEVLEITSSGTTDSLRVYGSTGSDGKIETNKVCDVGGTICFDPKVIGGDSAAGDGMKCPAGQYMSRISASQAKCVTSVKIACDTDVAKPVFKGIDATTGAPICGPVPTINCAAKPVTACSGFSNQQSYNLPSGTTNQTWSSSSTAFPIAGQCRTTNYKCVGSTWTETGSTGNCTAPADVVSTVACGAVIDSANAWAWAGNAIKTTKTNACGTATTTYDVTACTCKVASSGATLTCPAPYSGTYSGSKKSECYGQVTDGVAPEPTNVKTTYGAPTYVPTAQLYAPVFTNVTANSGTCTCASSDGWDFANCSTGYTRASSPTPNSFTSPTASWPSTATMGAYRKRTVNTSTCVATYTAYDTSNCTCDTTPTYSKAQKVCTDACEVPSGEALTISGVPLTMTKGDHVFKTDRNPTGCTPQTNQINFGVCVQQSFSWSSQGMVGTYTSANTPTRSIGGGCSCAEHSSGSTYRCRVPGDASNSIYDCKCQQARKFRLKKPAKLAGFFIAV